MDAVEFREYCLTKSKVTEGTPFGESVLVFKVAGKMFALMSLDGVPATANLKCNPDLALELRDRYRTCATRLSHEQEALEYGGNRRSYSGDRAAQNDRPFLRLGRAEPVASESLYDTARSCAWPSCSCKASRAMLRK